MEGEVTSVDAGGAAHSDTAESGKWMDQNLNRLSVNEIELLHVSHEFVSKKTAHTVLRDVTFGVAKGEFVALVGPSGCGKTTLLNIVAGFFPPTQGTVTVGGASVSGPSPERGIVLQRPALYPWLSVQDNILFGPTVTGHRREALAAAQRLMQEIGLERYSDYPPYELSGGMQQRVALARTLINDPPVLLMDEPFAALDAVTRSEMQELLLSIVQHRQCTVVFVTHDIEEAILLSDRVVVLGANPGTVKAEVDVPIRRPRSYEVVMEPEFGRLRHRVHGMIVGRTVDADRSVELGVKE